MRRVDGVHLRGPGVTVGMWPHTATPGYNQPRPRTGSEIVRPDLGTNPLISKELVWNCAFPMLSRKGHDDAALVHVTDPGWVERAVTTR